MVCRRLEISKACFHRQHAEQDGLKIDRRRSQEAQSKRAATERTPNRRSPVSMPEVQPAIREPLPPPVPHLPPRQPAMSEPREVHVARSGQVLPDEAAVARGQTQSPRPATDHGDAASAR